MKYFDLTPDPKVLIALTRTPLAPLDALCELIDNGLDAFAEGTRRGEEVPFPLIVLDIPGSAEVARGTGLIRIRDNAAGLTAEIAEKAVRAGYSGKNRFGSLGLFGMGFNIATGKLGARTRFSSTRRDSGTVSVEIDLRSIVASKSYDVPVTETPYEPESQVGTRIEIDGWWPEGDQNSSCIRKLAAYPKDTIREQLGRRYASILRQNKVRITINGDPCRPFEQCVWDQTRFVERVGWGRIPARFSFNEVLTTQLRCVECDQIVPPTETSCSECKSQSFRSIEERVRGWVGIQRFDSEREYGIDLIRNGRTIRVAEQSAFFEYTDEFKKSTKDYPIDSPYGRIVGEVHLDHVPVDFQKQDFTRTSDEWSRAMTFLRGDSSLLPTQPNADSNTSPIFKLFQGYRRVRNPGSRDMYMGFYDAGKAKRISREIEREYYAKFLERIPGFYDDAEWWKLVEQADQPPAEDLIICPNAECSAQNLKGNDICDVCSEILVGKNCIVCAKEIPASAMSCPSCGESQLPEVIVPWRCQICDKVNPHDVEFCEQCQKSRGSLNGTSQEHLTQHSDRSDELSESGFSLTLADGSKSSPIDLTTSVVRQPMFRRWNGVALPVVTFRSASALDIFIDTSHKLFAQMHQAPESMVASELADTIYELNRRLISQYPLEHAKSTIFGVILEKLFSAALEDNPERVRVGAQTLFDGIRYQLSRLSAEQTVDLFQSLDEQQYKALAANMISQRKDLSALSDATKTNEFLRYIDDLTVVDIFRKRPRLFFDGKVFLAKYELIEMPQAVLESAQSQFHLTYLNCIEDVAQYCRIVRPSALQSMRARASLDLLMSNFE